MDDEEEARTGCGGEEGGITAWWRLRKGGEKAAIVIALVALGLGAAAGLFILFGNIVKWLWNWIMPYLFKLPTIDFWMAWGIVALSMILFGRASGSSDSGSSRKRKRKIKVRVAEAAEGAAGQD